MGKPLAVLGEFQTSESEPPPSHDISIIELRMTTAYLVRDLDLKFAPDYKENWESDWKDYFVILHGSLPIIASPRA